MISFWRSLHPSTVGPPVQELVQRSACAANSPTPVKARKQGEYSIRPRNLPGSSPTKPCGSDGCQPLAGLNEQGRTRASQGAESLYQGGNRGGHPAQVWDAILLILLYLY